MKPIIKSFVKGEGKKDEVINASDGYVRNFLFPKNLAVEANAENMAKLQAQNSSKQFKKDTEKEEAQKLSEKMNKISLRIQVKAGENGKIFGGVSAKDISEAFEKQHNIKIDKMPKVDYVVANPPFAINNMQKGDKKLNNMLYKYGVFENASSYSKFIVMMLESVQEGGKISVVLPHGFLFKKTISECNLRKYLVDNGYIEAIISLPEKMFNGTKIPVIILVLQKKYREEDIIYIDASKEYIKGRKLNSLSEENQSKIIKTYENKSEISNYSIKVGAEIIRKNDYNLNIKKYLKSLKKEKSVNIKTEKQELQRLEEERVVIERKNRGIIKESIRYK